MLRTVTIRGLEVQGSEVQGSRFRVQGSGFRVRGSRFRGSGFRVQSSRIRAAAGLKSRQSNRSRNCKKANVEVRILLRTELKGIREMESATRSVLSTHHFFISIEHSEIILRNSAH
jgi:hypothetical protein